MSNLGGKKVSADTEGTGGPTGATGPAGPTTNTTKGDLEGFSTVAARIPVGTNGQHLEADSTQALGLKWATPSAGSTFHGALVERSTTLARTGTEITNLFLTEVYDTDSFVDLGADDDRITVPANVTKVQVCASMEVSNIGSTNGRRLIVTHFNSSDAEIHNYSAGGTHLYSTVMETVTTPVIVVSSGDYFKLTSKSNDTSWSQEHVSMGLEYKDGTL